MQVDLLVKIKFTLRVEDCQEERHLCNCGSSVVFVIESFVGICCSEGQTFNKSQAGDTSRSYVKTCVSSVMVTQLTERGAEKSCCDGAT
jgi:hypothetical protein